MSRPGYIASMCSRNFASIAIMSSMRPWIGQSLIIQISLLRSTMVALISPGFSWMSFHGSSPSSMMRLRASFTHLGHSESVTRGQPRVGLVFCHDFCNGLSDHFGVNDSLGLNWLKNWMVLNSAPAATDNPFSTYLIGLCIVFLKIVFCLVNNRLFR